MELRGHPMLIIFPSDYSDVKTIDPDYAAEYEAVCKIQGFKVILFDYDTFAADGLIKLFPKDYYSGAGIYRGWMLTPAQYATLYAHLVDKGIKLINAPEEYCACHLFPAVRDRLADSTPGSLCFAAGENIDWNLVNGAFKRFIVKDYVKSVKETDFPCFFETPVAAAEMEAKIAEFVAHRGSLFTGGIVLKEYVELKKYGGRTNEYRAFYLNHQLLSLCRNSNQADSCPAVPPYFASRFSHLPSNYYTVDFAELADGSWTVIETGDGQVSGLSPGQWPFKYYDDMRQQICAD
jgi:hypothetical protein